MECSSDFLDPGDKRKAAQSRTATADSKRQYRGFSPDGTTGSALLDRNELEVAKVLLNTVVRNPHLLHDPDLKFVKSFLQHFGATIPSQQELESPHALADESGHDSSVDLDGEEFSEDDFLEEGYDDKLIPPETVPPPPRGAHPRLESEYSEEETLRAAEYRALAKSSYEAGDLNAAIENLTVALQLHPSALLYARRAEALLAQLRPNAALVDCNVALEINPESAKALKIRGRIHRAFGDWESACNDLWKGLSADYDAETALVLKECQERRDALLARRRARQQRDQSRRAACKEQNSASSVEDDDSSCRTGQTGLSQADTHYLESMTTDPDLIAAVQNPQVKAAMLEIIADPAAAAHHMLNPEIGKIMLKLMQRAASHPANIDDE